jgi:DNA polymerase III delta prime subunit
MSDEYAHLNDAAKEALKLTNEDRIARIRAARWIGYTRAREILEQLEELLTHPKKHRMPNLLLYGDTNNGKTMIVNRFHQLHLAHDNPGGDGIVLPILIVQCPPVPDENRFYNAILEKLFAPYKSSDRVDKKQFQAIKTLERVRLKVLVLDELHNLIAGNTNRQRHFLNTIKYLGNELQIPIVGVGTKDALVALRTDPQLANRFEPAELPRWQMGKDYLKLLASFERMLPLKKPSNLIETNLAIKLLSMSEGIIGELSAILTKAAVKAIKSGKEQITVELLNSIKWIQPSKRK